jgi:hypothetical protein
MTSMLGNFFLTSMLARAGLQAGLLAKASRKGVEIITSPDTFLVGDSARA